MKNVLNLLCVLILVVRIPSLSAQPVFQGSVTFNTQAELDAWDPAFTSITGKLEISGGGITDLSPLLHIVSIGVSASGDFEGLTIKFCPDLVSLAGLNALETVEGDVNIITNSALQNLDGLEYLQAVGGGFQINRNVILTSVTGLSNLNSLGGALIVRENDILPDLTGLEGLTQIQALKIILNASLTSLEVLSNVSVSQYIEINGNPVLTSLNGLEGTGTLTDNLVVISNAQLSDCCAVLDLLDTQGAVGGSIVIGNNQTGCDNQAEVLNVCAVSVDDDCDGVPNNQDFCPGGDDSVDGNGDHNPDCHIFPGIEYLPVAWRCGNKNQKVLICHEGSTLCVGVNALAGHLSHGDYIGPCNNASCEEQHAAGQPKSRIIPDAARTLSTNSGLTCNLYPNPALNETWLELSGLETAIHLLDMHGLLLMDINLAELVSGPYRLGLADVPPGVYFVQLTGTGMAPQVLKLTVQAKN